MDSIVYGVAKSQTQLNDFHFHYPFPPHTSLFFFFTQVLNKELFSWNKINATFKYTWMYLNYGKNSVLYVFKWKEKLKTLWNKERQTKKIIGNRDLMEAF